MARAFRLLVLLPIALLFSGCYYAVIDTGRPKGNRTIQQTWSPSYAGGMVPPKLARLAARCPVGAARVEARQSAANVFVTAITLGIYAPTTVTVTCAAPGSPRPASPIA